MSTAHERSLIGSVFERTTLRPPSAPSPRFTGTPGTGFPTAQHRFKSAFARARDGANVGGANRMDVPSVVSTQSQTNPPVAQTAAIFDPKPIPTDTDALRRQIHEENTRRVAQMNREEIEEEKRAILDQLGEGTGELLRRVQEARRRKEAKEREAQAALEEQAAKEGKWEVAGLPSNDDARRTSKHDHDHEQATSIASPTPHRISYGLAVKPGVLRVKSLENIGHSVPSPLPATSSTRPSSRTGRKLRFAEVTPDDVYVYESAPRSPKRTVLALPSPPDTKDDSIVSLGTVKNVIPFERSHPTDGPAKDEPNHITNGDEEPEEGTAEYIRRRYFPSVPTNDPSVAWMKASPPEATDSSAPRFDLHGVPISAFLSATLPSHLGLHHHAEGSHAGYTIDDIFLLSRSTVPAQRASMLGILAKIAHRLSGQVQHSDNPERIVTLAGQEDELRKRILATGLAAVDQIGSVGARAAELVWECLVKWDRPTNELEGVELALAPDVVSLLQLDHFLPTITDVFSHAALPSESLAQLLAVVHWLAQQSNKVADMIMNTPRLIPTILKTFLLTPIPAREGSLPPNPLALQLLITLASASRSNASALLDPADALLRFITLLPPSSPYSPALASTLLTYTLRFYTTLASYGLYAHIATTAFQLFTTLASHIISTSLSFDETASASVSQYTHLRTAWVSLVHAWTVCATDPHTTSPPHEILWSQVCAWGWAADVRKLREGLGNDRSVWVLYAAIWDAEAAWLEGARINSVKSGEAEREEALQTLRSTFSAKDGTEYGIVQCALEAVQRDLAEGGPAVTIQDGERLLESFASAGNVLASALRLFLACLPPINDGALLSAPPFALPLSELSALSAALVKHPIWFLPSTLGAAYLQVYLRPLTQFVIQFHRVSRYIPGTTPQLWFAQALAFLPRLLPGDESHAFAMLDTLSLITPRFIGVDLAELSQSIHVDALRPFFEYAVRPEGEVYVSPLRPSTESVSRSSTLRLPSPHSPGSGEDSPVQTLASGLPLTHDFLFTPLTHLLRSGTSPVFRAMPGNWTASEVDLVRATLLLVFAARKVLVAHGLEGFVHGAAEVVFGCMRVCMLEHGVGIEGTEVEVFRDAGVERLMAWLLEPFTVRTLTRPPPHTRSLEDVSAPYLGSTPFYQFYTDLVGLYGSVSFGHSIFAALVVTPLAMQYAVDYRRVLWCGGNIAISGQGHPNGRGGGTGGAGLGDIVKSVRIPIEAVICTSTVGAREYLYPIERDAGVLGAYLAALVAQDGGGVDGFLRFVAVHHVACTVWRDLDTDGGEDEEGAAKEREREEVSGREEIRARLLRVVLMRGDVNAVREVVLYRQRSRGALVWPPTCYYQADENGGWREERLAFVQQSMGEDVVNRVRGSILT